MENDRTHYIDKVNEDTLRYIRELLDDNDRLQKTVSRLLAHNIDLEERLTILRNDIAAKERLERSLEEDARRYTDEFAAIEAQNASLAKLYVASYQLHSTFTRDGVLQTIMEIIANLIGSEDAAVYELSDDEQRLSAISSMGADVEHRPDVAVGFGTIGAAAAANAIHVADGGSPGSDGISAVIPLSVEARVIGAVAVFKLLPQKTHLLEVDREMFDLLAVHAASALYCATLSERARSAS